MCARVVSLLWLVALAVLVDRTLAANPIVSPSFEESNWATAWAIGISGPGAAQRVPYPSKGYYSLALDLGQGAVTDSFVKVVQSSVNLAGVSELEVDYFVYNGQPACTAVRIYAGTQMLSELPTSAQSQWQTLHMSIPQSLQASPVAIEMKVVATCSMPGRQATRVYFDNWRASSLISLSAEMHDCQHGIEISACYAASYAGPKSLELFYGTLSVAKCYTGSGSCEVFLPDVTEKEGVLTVVYATETGTASLAKFIQWGCGPSSGCGVACPALSDNDADGVPNAYDNCPDKANPDQQNSVIITTACRNLLSPLGDACRLP